MSQPTGLLQPLPILEGKWESILMEFITGLPMVQRKDCIFVVVDQLTKYTHFFSISAHYTVAQVAELFFREIFSYMVFLRQSLVIGTTVSWAGFGRSFSCWSGVDTDY